VIVKALIALSPSLGQSIPQLGAEVITDERVRVELPRLRGMAVFDGDAFREIEGIV
jgi:hypothetical protein